jgi:hypothetical protein
MAIALLKGSILSLYDTLPLCSSISGYKANWVDFLNSSIFVPVTGETRNITDSGNIVAGNLRRVLKIDEETIVQVDQFYNPTYKHAFDRYKRVIFFDDFVGSGQQFITMWTEDFEKDGGFLPSIKEKCTHLNLSAHYCGMVGTEYGISNIKKSAPDVDLRFAHILTSSASALHKDSSIWPGHLKDSGPQFIEKASVDAGIPKKEVAGFHNLGLSLAFEFTIPDATLPIFRWNKGGWSPLMKS